MAKKKKKPKQSGKTMAEKADRFDLYQRSVQEPDAEVKFFRRAYRDAYDRLPRVLREDFSGTSAVSCRWVKGKPERRAIAVDLDPSPIAWGREHNLAKLNPAEQKRLEFVIDDVREVMDDKADVLAAQNFSFFIFKTRDELLDYFAAARANLADRGILVLDMMGGPECHKEDHEDEREISGKITYVWEQERFDPISHDCLFHIHFRFKDGSEIEHAFSYAWRMWTIPEVRELLDEAGFVESHVYWEGTDRETGEGNGVSRRRKSAPADPCWVAYVVGVK